LGFGHGVAHGTEMQGSVLTFAVGAGLTTFALHLSGSAFGRWMMQRRWEIAMGGGLLGGGLFQLARLLG
jgi:hydrogenase/urease accessory protein HupE